MYFTQNTFPIFEFVIKNIISEEKIPEQDSSNAKFHQIYRKRNHKNSTKTLSKYRRKGEILKKLFYRP